MAIDKKSLITKGSAKNSTSTKKSSAVAPAAPGKMVSAMKLAKATPNSIHTTRAMSVRTARTII